jgi:ABC-type sugar transport system substrate-binding protein
MQEKIINIFEMSIRYKKFKTALIIGKFWQWINMCLLLLLIGCRAQFSQLENNPTLNIEQSEQMQTTQSSSTPTPVPVVGLILPNLEEPFFSELSREAQMVVPQQKGELLIIDAKNDASIMTQGIEELLTRAAAALWIAPLDDYKVKTALEKAQLQGLPIVSFGKMPEGFPALTEIISDEKQGAGEAATMTCRALRKQGKMLVLRPVGEEYGEEYKIRIDSYMQRVNEECPLVETTTVLLSGMDGLDVQQALAPYLTDNTRYEGIFSPEDKIIIQAIEEVKQSGLLGWIFIGFEDSSAAKAALQAEELSAFVEPQPNLFIQQAAEAVFRYQEGKTTEKTVSVPMNLALSDVGLNLPLNPEYKALKIGMVLPNITEEFNHKAYLGARLTAHSLTGTKFFGFDAKDDPQKYATSIDILTERGVDGILLAGLDSPEVNEALRKAVKAGVRLYSINRRLSNEISPVIHIGSDEMAIGIQSALVLCEQMKTSGVEQPLMAILQENDASIDLQKRNAAFVEGVNQYCPKKAKVQEIRLVGGGSEAEKRLEQELRKERIHALLAENSELAQMAIRAADGLNNDLPFIVVFGDSSQVRKALREGKNICSD